MLKCIAALIVLFKYQIQVKWDLIKYYSKKDKLKCAAFVL